MVWGAEITNDIIKAAIIELYRLKSFNAIESLAFFKKYGVHFQNKEDIKIEALKRGYRFLGKPSHYVSNRKVFIENQIENKYAVYEYEEEAPKKPIKNKK